MCGCELSDSAMPRKKVCIVPSCGNNSVNCPDKLFIRFPKDLHSRQRWWLATKAKGYFKESGYLHCCEDHFDVSKWKTISPSTQGRLLESALVNPSPNLFILIALTILATNIQHSQTKTNNAWQRRKLTHVLQFGSIAKRDCQSTPLCTTHIYPKSSHKKTVYDSYNRTKTYTGNAVICIFRLSCAK